MEMRRRILDTYKKAWNNLINLHKSTEQGSAIVPKDIRQRGNEG